MIRFTLKCATGHGFESWFADTGAFEALQSGGKLACPVCGETRVEKALMAPAVRPARNKTEGGLPGRAAGDAAGGKGSASLSAPGSEIEAAFAELRRKVEENSEYVGDDFVTEARRIHDGAAPERAIHGEARPEEARRLIEDGIPVAPLPFIPSRKTN